MRRASSRNDSRASSRPDGQKGEAHVKMLTKPKQGSCCVPEKAAQCCAKASRLVSGCHD